MAAAESDPVNATNDSYLWLEEIEGEKALAFAKEQNAKCLEAIVGASGKIEDTDLYRRTLQVLESKDKIPHCRKIGEFYYNFWQDEQHVRGIWRRLPANIFFEEFQKPQSDKWETVIDVDALGKAEGQSFVWHRYRLLQPDEDRILVMLSPGGTDADEMREFCLKSLKFVDPEGPERGFRLPTAKTRVCWKDRDTVYVGTKFEGSENEGLTDSGYPRLIKEWRRGAPLAEAALVYEGEQADVSISGSRDIWVSDAGPSKNLVYDWIHRGITFYTSEHRLRIVGSAGDGSATSSSYTTLALPEDAEACSYFEFLLVELRSAWGGFAAGSLLAGSAAEIEQLSREGKGSDAVVKAMTALFTPTETLSLNSFACTKSYVVLNATDALRPKLITWERTADGTMRRVGGEEVGEGAADAGGGGDVFRSITLAAVDSDRSDALWVTAESFLSPSCLHYAEEAAALTETKLGRALRSVPAFFDNTDMVCEQHWAVSADGTRVPYFLVGKQKTPGGEPQTRPTLLYGYGGFEISFTPVYGAVTGLAWMEAGGLFAVGNIRGGGEFGPRWHQAALKEKRQRAYEDFEAVAEHLLSSGHTGPGQLACMGGSNGGLLVGNMLTREKRKLFRAVVCQVPLLDMQRYHKLLAGASWMAEYGDPEKPEEWAFIQKFSPFHMVTKGMADVPQTLFDTSTKDDRVHPGHARKMVAKLQAEVPESGCLYYENIEGGHGGAADMKQRAFMKTMEFLFLKGALGL